jgi:hypothetical protein
MTWTIASRTDSNKAYEVRQDESGGFSCPCRGFMFYHRCCHVTKAQEMAAARIFVSNLEQRLHTIAVNLDCIRLDPQGLDDIARMEQLVQLLEHDTRALRRSPADLPVEKIVRQPNGLNFTEFDL